MKKYFVTVTKTVTEHWVVEAETESLAVVAYDVYGEKTKKITHDVDVKAKEA